MNAILKNADNNFFALSKAEKMGQLSSDLRSRPWFSGGGELLFGCGRLFAPRFWWWWGFTRNGCARGLKSHTETISVVQAVRKITLMRRVNVK